LELEIEKRRSNEYFHRRLRNILVYGVTVGCYIYTGITKHHLGFWGTALSTPALVGDAFIVISYPISAIESIQESKREILEAVKDSKKSFKLYRN
jgi:Na+-translocating ferredoxin:NAD+ oxidoreductase RnfD subunit